MASGPNQINPRLRVFARFDQNGQIITGSVIRRYRIPRTTGGYWLDITNVLNAAFCGCFTTTTTSTTTSTTTTTVAPTTTTTTTV